MSIFSTYDNFIFDMDGVLYLADQPIASALEFADRVTSARKNRLFLTNNSTYTRSYYREKLTRMGVKGVTEDEVLTSASAAVSFMAGRGDVSGKSAYALGGEGLCRELRDAGVKVLEGDAGRKCDFVVVGWDTELTFEKLKIAVLAVNAGAEFIATNDDATFPAPDGLWPGAGAIVAAVERATGKEALVIGKPHPYMMQVALARFDGDPSRTVLIGDRLETDIQGGYDAGIKTALVLTGVATRQDAERSSVKPDHVLESLDEWA